MFYFFLKYNIRGQKVNAMTSGTNRWTILCPRDLHRMEDHINEVSHTTPSDIPVHNTGLRQRARTRAAAAGGIDLLHMIRK